MNISVAGVAEKEGKVLIALRKPGTSIGEKWEFPGGKLEEGEVPETALIREYREELGISIQVNSKLCEGTFSNGNKDYKLIAFSINLESENFIHPEHQQVKWVKITDLTSYDLPGSDIIILNHLLSR